MRFIGKFLKENFMYILLGMLVTYIYIDHQGDKQPPQAVTMPTEEKYQGENNDQINEAIIPDKTPKHQYITRENISEFYQEF